MQAALEAGTWNVPTLVRYQKNMLPTEEHERRYSSAEARYVRPRVVERMWRQRSAGRYRAFDDADLEAGREVFEAKKAFVAALHEGGAGLLLGSDDWFQGFATHQELENLVGAGLTPYEAISTGTRNAAAFVGAADEFGVVRVGSRADLVLLENDPLEDVRHARDPVGVVLRGRWLPREELRETLDAVADSYAAEP